MNILLKIFVSLLGGIAGTLGILGIIYLVYIFPWAIIVFTVGIFALVIYLLIE